MNVLRNVRWKWFALAVLALTLLVGSVPLAFAAERYPVVMPYYARLGAEEVYHTDEWAFVVFYRPPECVPGDFNLLDFFDFPDDGPGAFGCVPETVDGFSVGKGGPMAAPLHSELHGLGDVPVWFVRWPELQVAIEDGQLTIGDLANLPSLIEGRATFYKETLHPTGGAVVSMIQMVGSGTLEDGRQFQFSAALTENQPDLTHVRVVFR